jgi:hypothetical protein
VQRKAIVVSNSRLRIVVKRYNYQQLRGQSIPSRRKFTGAREQGIRRIPSPSSMRDHVEEESPTSPDDSV